MNRKLAFPVFLTPANWIQLNILSTCTCQSFNSFSSNPIHPIRSDPICFSHFSTNTNRNKDNLFHPRLWKLTTKNSISFYIIFHIYFLLYRFYLNFNFILSIHVLPLLFFFWRERIKEGIERLTPPPPPPPRLAKVNSFDIDLYYCTYRRYPEFGNTFDEFAAFVVARFP